MKRTPRLKFKQVIDVLTDSGFEPDRRRGGSSVVFKGIVDGELRTVPVRYNHLSDTCNPGVQKDIIQRSGLGLEPFID